MLPKRPCSSVKNWGRSTPRTCRADIVSGCGQGRGAAEAVNDELADMAFQHSEQATARHGDTAQDHASPASLTSRPNLKFMMFGAAGQEKR